LEHGEDPSVSNLIQEKTSDCLGKIQWSKTAENTITNDLTWKKVVDTGHQ
jgi:hypothetical protein